MVTIDRAQGLWVIAVTLLLAFVLSVLALPGTLPSTLAYARPEWVLLVLIYWAIATPHRLGIFTAWCGGLVLDLLTGTLLGQHAIATIIVVYIAATFYQRMRMFAVWQQGLVVFALCFLGQLIDFAIESLADSARWHPLYFLPSLVSGLLWPWVFLCLRFLRRRFAVN